MVDYKRIDPHVHFRGTPLQSYKETIIHGLQLAHSVGIGKVIGVTNLPEPYTVFDQKTAEAYLAEVPTEERDNFFIYMSLKHDRNQVAQAVWCYNNMPLIGGIKLFAGPSTGDLGIIDPNDQQDIFRWVVEEKYDGPLPTHCEEDALIQKGVNGKQFFNPDDPISHCRARPKECEIESARRIISLAIDSGFRGTLHIMHASVPDTVDLVSEAKRNRNAKCRFTVGATPHHLIYDEGRMRWDDWYNYKMNPPLRSAQDVQDLGDRVGKMEVDWIETDHSPHSVGEKMYGYEKCPSGHPSLLIYPRCVDELLPSLGLSPEQIKTMTRDNILDVFEKLQ